MGYFTLPPYKNTYKNTYPFPNISRENLFYDYCKKRRHTQEKCYKLHGLPPNFKLTKGKNSVEAATVHGGYGEIMDDMFVVKFHSAS